MISLGGILTVADDLLKNDGRKFLDLMEQLAHRKVVNPAMTQPDDDNSMSDTGDGWDDYDEGSNSEDYEDDEVGFINTRSDIRIIGAINKNWRKAAGCFKYLLPRCLSSGC